MRTEFPKQSQHPDIRQADSILRSCVHCGFCLPACPTYLETRSELDSPRGRILLIKDQLEAIATGAIGTVGATEITSTKTPSMHNPTEAKLPLFRGFKHLDRCLSCYACVTACPSGVNYRHLVELAREHARPNATIPLFRSIQQRSFLYLARNPLLFRTSTLFLATLRPIEWLLLSFGTYFGLRPTANVLGTFLGSLLRQLPPRLSSFAETLQPGMRPPRREPLDQSFHFGYENSNFSAGCDRTGLGLVHWDAYIARGNTEKSGGQGKQKPSRKTKEVRTGTAVSFWERIARSANRALNPQPLRQGTPTVAPKATSKSGPANLTKTSGPRSSIASETALRIAVLPGCLQDALSPEINVALISVLARAGCETVLLPTSCCGSLASHNGQNQQARNEAMNSLSLLQQAGQVGGFDAITIASSGCESALADVAFLLRQEFLADHDVPIGLAPAKNLAAPSPKTATSTRTKKNRRKLEIEARGLQQAIRDPAELLLGQLLHLPRLTPVPNPAASPTAAEFRIVWHAPCSLQHALKKDRFPRQVLTELGISIQTPREETICCGAAGSYTIMEPNLSLRLAKRKTRNLLESKPDLILSANVGCMNQIQSQVQVPVLHWLEYVDFLLGSSVPKRVRHLWKHLPLRGFSSPLPGSTSNLMPQDGGVLR